MGIKATFEIEGGGFETFDYIPKPTSFFDPKRNSAALNINSTFDRQPDEEAEILQLAEKTRWTPEIVRANKKDAIEQARKEDFRSIDEGLLLGFIAKSPDNAALVKDDIPKLREATGYLDQILNYGSKLAEDVEKSYDTGDITLQLAPLYRRKFIDQENSPELDTEIKALEDSIPKREQREDFLGEVATITSEQIPLVFSSVRSGLDKVGEALPSIAGSTLIAGLATGGALAVPVALGSTKAMFALGVAEEIAGLETPMAAKEYSQFRDEDGNPLDKDVLKYAALTVGFISAGIELATDVVTLGLLKKVPGFKKLLSLGPKEAVKQALRRKQFRDALKRISKMVIGTSLINGLEEAVQQLVTILGGETAKELSGKEFGEVGANEASKRVLGAWRVGMLGGFGFGMITGSVGLGVSTVQQIQQGALKGLTNKIIGRPQQYYNEQIGLTERLDETKTKVRSPAKIKELLEDGGLVDSAFIDGAEANSFYQIEGNAEIFTKLGITKQEVAEAAITGQSLAIKLSEIHSKLSLEESKKFFEIVQESDGSLSLQDSKDINLKEELTRINEFIDTVNKEQIEFQKEKDRIESEVRDVVKIRKLKQPESYAKGVAELLGNFSQRMAIEGDQSPSTTLKRIRTEVANLKDVGDAEKFLAENGVEGSVPAGVTQIVPEGYIMKLFENANHSTLLHEPSHIFLLEVESIVSMNKASDALVKDYQIAREWMGVKPGEAISRGQQEQFAKAFELYLREGKAPTQGLKKFFERFKKWLTVVYEKVKDSPIDVNLTDEVRGVFDRLINVEVQTKQFLEANEFVVSDQTLTDLGVSEEARIDFRRRLAGASRTANREVQQQLAKEYKKNIEMWREEAKIEVDVRRVNNLYLDLTSSKRGFSLASSSQYLSAKQLNELPPNTFSEEGMDPKIIAERFGYKSVGAMFKAFRTPLSEIKDKGFKVKTDEGFIGKAMDPKTTAERFGYESVGEMFKAFRTPLSDIKDKGVPLKADKGFTVKANEGFIGKAMDPKTTAERFGYESVGEMFKGFRTPLSDIKDKRFTFKADKGFTVKADEGAVKVDKEFVKAKNLKKFMSNIILGLNKAELEFQIGKQATIRLKAKNSRLVRKDGQSPSVLSLEYGYNSLDEMIKDLAQRESRNDQVKEIVLQKERSHYLDFTSRDFFLDEKTKVLDKSMKALGKFIQEKAGVELDIPGKEYKKIVDAKFAGVQVKEATRTDRHLDSMRKSLRKRDKAIKQGKFKEAAKFHEQARLGYEFAKRSNQIRKAQTELKNLVKKSGRSKGKIEFDYWKNIMSLGNKFGFKRGKEPQKVIPFQELLDAQTSLIDSGVKFRSWIMDEQNKSFKDLTVNQFEELKVLFDVLNHIGRKIRKDETVLSKQKFAEVKQGLVDQTSSLPPRKITDSDTAWGKLNNFGRSILSELNTISHYTTRLDGFTEIIPRGKVGPWSSQITEPLYKADSEYLRLNSEISAKMKDSLDQLTRSFAENPNVISSITVPIPETLRIRGRTWRFERVLMIAFNMGNRQNIQAVKEGYGLSDSDLNNILAVLTEADWNAIQEIGDILGEYREELFATKKRITGFPPTTVKPDVFVTPSGQKLKGWYFPLKRDSSSVSRKQVIDFDKRFRETEAAAISDGPTQERKGFGGNPVKLSLSVLSQHVEFIALYLSHAETVKDISKIFEDKELSELIVEKIGEQALESMRDSLKNIARAKFEVLSTLDILAERVRGMGTVHSLGMKIATAVKQIFSIPLFWSRYGVDAYYLGVKKVMHSIFTGGIGELIQEVYRLSPYMKSRSDNLDVQINEAVKRGLLEKPFAFGVKKSQIYAALFILIRAVDSIAVFPCWLGAFEDGKRQFNGDVAKATAYADKSIRTTQPSFRPIDLSPIQHSRKGIARAFTFFSTFTLLYGRNKRAMYTALTKGQMSPGQFLRSFSLESIVPPLAMTFTFAAFRGDIPEIKEILGDLFSYNLSGIPLVKDFGFLIGSKIKGGYSPDSWSSPLFTPLVMGWDLIDYIFRLIQDLDDDKLWKRTVMGLTELVSFIAKVPVPRMARDVIKGMEQWERGEGTFINVLIPQTPNKK